MLLEKLSDTKIDTSFLKSLKELGAGGETKRQRFEEALLLEQTGRGNDDTKSILYEEREVRDWEDDEEMKRVFLKPAAKDESSDLEDSDVEPSTSLFIDHRPRGPIGAGFGFSDLKTIPKVKQSSYNWRAKLAIAKARKHGIDLADIDGDSTTGASESEEEDEEDSDADSGEEGEEEGEENVDEEEWTGFDNTADKNSTEESLEVAENQNEEDEESEEEESEEEESEEEEESDLDGSSPKKSKGQEFIEWAKKQTAEEPISIEVPKFEGTYIPVERQEDKESLPVDFSKPHLANDRKAYFVNVTRPEAVVESRLKLPVVAEEQWIMEAIKYNDCVVICGQTGSGKTTQVPQFLYEAGYGSPGSGMSGLIGITQPRRVAAVSMANRVRDELGDKGHVVGHQIRFDSNVKSNTAIKFMTDGILLRELSNDFVLTKYSAIIIDEAHERVANTDILIGVLSRVVKLRRDMANKEPTKHQPLKLIIMSATLRIKDFTENKTLFSDPPPVLKVEKRQHPVSVHFNKKTPYNYLDEVYRKTCKIHQKLPPGGILIFLTGQNEITQMCKRLQKAFPFRGKKVDSRDPEISVRVSAKDTPTEAEDVDFGIDVDVNEDEVDDFDVAEEEEDEEGFDETLEEGQDARAPLHVLPLYSLLPTNEQMKVFDEPPAGSRLCVVATNVAETSLTIPGIRYVVDSGRSKERVFDEDTGVQQFVVNWISKASSEQRSGRAGRTGPGHCYRIFSSAVYERDFVEFSRPEILRMPIEGLVLNMKAMGIDKIVNFPFPTPPDRSGLQKGLNLLKYLGAIDDKETLTHTGKLMSLFPLSPRFSKMLTLGNQLECLPYIIAVVAALTVGDPFIGEYELGIEQKVVKPRVQNDEEKDDYEESDDEYESVADKEFKRKLRADYHRSQNMFSRLDPKSDALKLLAAVCAYDWDKSPEEFSKSHYLRFKIMKEISDLRVQVTRIVAATTKPNDVKGTISKLSTKLKPPSSMQVKAIKQMISAGFLDQLAIRADVLSSDHPPLRAKTRIIDFPYATLFPSRYRTKAREEVDPFVYIHPDSVLTESLTNQRPPSYLVYNTLQVSQNKSGEIGPDGQPVMGKIRMKVLVDIEPTQLFNVAKETSLVTYSKPLGAPYGPVTISPTKRECWLVPRMGAAIGTGGVGWDLKVVKVLQEKEGLHWITRSILK